MEKSKDRKKYQLEYRKAHMKRVPLDLRNADYELLKEAAAAAGEPVNTYIKNAIKLRFQVDKVEKHPRS